MADLGTRSVSQRPPGDRLPLIPPPQRLLDPNGPAAGRPFLMDLSQVPEDGLAAGVRDGWFASSSAAARVVIDLGERRTLPADVIDELLITHRALRRAGGRCALVVGPALASQLALAHPEGIMWA